MEKQGGLDAGTAHGPHTGTAAGGPARDLFISYSSADEQTAREMRRHVEQAGYSCWMAPDDVRGMDPWAEQILEAIEGCRVMIVLLSANANASRHVSREVNLALGKGKAILPVRIEAVPPEGALEYLLSLVQRVDAFPPPFRSHLEQIQAHLAAVLAQPLAGAPQPVTRRPAKGAHRAARSKGRFDSRLGAALGGVVVGLLLLVALAMWPALSGGQASPSPTPTGIPRGDIRSFADFTTVLGAALTNTGGPADYDAYVRRTDNSGQLESEFPAEWNDVSGITFVNPAGVPVGVLLAASTDLSRVYQAFDTAGLFVGASSDQAATFDPERFLDEVRPTFMQNCLLAGRHDVDVLQPDGHALTGKLVVWRNCQRSPTVIVQAALVRDDRMVAYMIDARANTPADVAALRHGLERLRVVTPFIVTPGGAPPIPTPGPPG